MTLLSDGTTVYECTSSEEVVDLLRGGQGVFGIAVSGALRELRGSLAQLPGERADGVDGAAGESGATHPHDELARRRQHRTRHRLTASADVSGPAPAVGCRAGSLRVSAADDSAWESRRPPLDRRGAEGATSPEPLRHPDRALERPLWRGRARQTGTPSPAGGGVGPPILERTRSSTPSPTSSRPARFAARHIGRRPTTSSGCSTRSATPRSTTCSPTPSRPSIREKLRPGPAAGGVRGRGRRRTARAGRPQPGAHLDDRPRLLRHDHPAGHPPQRAREPGLVHRLHALPARDQPGPARGAAELPDRWSRTSPGCRSPARRCWTRRTAAAEAMALAHRAAKTGDTFVVDADVLPQTLDVVRTRAVPLGLERRRARPVRAAARRRRLRRARRSTRARPARSATSRRWSRRRTSAARCVVVAADLLALTLITPPGEARRRHRGRHHPALRRADGLRRPARRLPGGALGPRAAAARPPRRRLGRRRRRAGVPARPADPRAAHPPGEGDVQHLHRAGAARRDRVDVRRLPRPGRAARDRAARAPAGLDPGRRAAGGRGRRRRRPVLRHDHRRGCRAAADAVVGAAPRRRHQPAPGRRRHRVGVAATRPRPGRTSSRSGRPSAARRGRRRASRRRRRRSARRRARRDFLTHPVFNSPPLRDGDAALPAPARRPRLRARPRHDPARLVHDEAQRDHRDGAGDQPRVRRHAPVRAGRPVRRLPRAVRRPRDVAGRDHRLRRDLAAAQRRLAGRVRRAARDPRLPPQQRATSAATSA